MTDHMLCTCGAPVHDHRTHLGYCGQECLDSAVFWEMIRQPLTELLAQDDCYRCGSAGINAVEPDDGLCLGCRAEVVTNRDEARRELADFIAADDGTDSGRMPLGGWTS